MEKPVRILSKRQFFELWEQNVLGNRTNLWRDPKDAFASGAPRIGFREIGKSGGGVWEDCPRIEVFDVAKRWHEAGRNFIMDDGCPDHLRTIQGEICRTYRGLEGTIDVIAQFPMRRAFKEGHMRSYRGASVLVLLGQYMDPSSRDDLDILLETYPDATIEFTCFSVDVGILANRNTLFWEVRNY